MASWAAVPALAGFSWDGAAQAMAFGANEGTYFWSNGEAWGTCRVTAGGRAAEVTALGGSLTLRSFKLGGAAPKGFRTPKTLKTGEMLRIDI
jgi:hypothetical protein